VAPNDTGAGMKDQILALFKEKGELYTVDIALPNVNRKTLLSHLSRMWGMGLLNRRQLPSKTGPMFAYSLVDSDERFLFGEPDYAYYLRNIGRKAND